MCGGSRNLGRGCSLGSSWPGKVFVHAHLLYYGPYVVMKWLRDLLRKGYSRVGELWIQDVGRGKEKGFAIEAAKYCAKLVSSMSEGWLAGEAAGGDAP